ncbi:hypothetical protein ACMFMG_002768 [Clarireedia jacksonii]
MEAAGLVLGVLGIAGLFSACIDNFDIVVRAKDFSEDFDILCTLLVTQRVQFAIWGELVGLVADANGKKLPYNKAIDRPDIRSALERTLNNIRLLLQKADVIVDRYEIEYGSSPSTEVSTSKGMDVFKDHWDSFKTRLRKNQKQKSVTKVTRWAVHDSAQFEKQVSRIKELVEALYSITSSLGLLEQQHARLKQEIESISDTQSLRLLRDAASVDHRASSLIQDVSDTASRRLTFVTKSITGGRTITTNPTGAGSSFYTARSRTSVRSTVSVIDEESNNEINNGKLEDHTDSISELVQEKMSAAPTLDLPQNQRLLAEILKKADKHKPLSFASGDRSYGQQLAAYKKSDEDFCLRNSARMIAYASTGTSAAKRMFFELRRIREAGVPFVSAAPIGDDLSRILASIEGPPETPYEGGIFWITVSVSEENPSKPPLLRFHTRVYHPNVDHKGNICADYQERWNALPKSRYVKGAYKDPNSQWFQETTGIWSLGALLTALCALLATPDVEDPLVPEIAQVYLENYDNYCAAAKLYTQRYATPSKPDESSLVFSNEIEDAPSEHSEEEMEPEKSLEEKLRQDEYTDEADTLASLSSSDTMKGFESWLEKYRAMKESQSFQAKSRDQGTKDDRDPFSKYNYFYEGPPSYSFLYEAPTPVYSAAPKYSPGYTNGQYQTKHSRTSKPASSRKSKLNETTRVATEKDARAAGIPYGYSLKNWDPSEKPILFYGSAFDANSLGKWIYDHTVEKWGPATPISEMAGELWLLLIQVSSKSKRMEEALPKMSHSEDREMIEDFFESSERLMRKLERLFKRAEKIAMIAYKSSKPQDSTPGTTAQKEDQSETRIQKSEQNTGSSSTNPRNEQPSSTQTQTEHGKVSKTSTSKISETPERLRNQKANVNFGTDFVNTIFGMYNELPTTERLMIGLRLWNMRFDANCEDIIRRVSKSATTKLRSQNEEVRSEAKYVSVKKQTNNHDGDTPDRASDEDVPDMIAEDEFDKKLKAVESSGRNEANINSNTKTPAGNGSRKFEEEKQTREDQGSGSVSEKQAHAAKTDEITATADTRKSLEGWSGCWSRGASWGPDIQKGEVAKQDEADGKTQTIDDDWSSFTTSIKKKKRKKTHKQVDILEVIPSELAIPEKKLDPVDESDPWGDWRSSSPNNKKKEQGQGTADPDLRSDWDPAKPEHPTSVTNVPYDRISKDANQSRSLARRIPRKGALHLTIGYLRTRRLESVFEVDEEEEEEEEEKG